MSEIANRVNEVKSKIEDAARKSGRRAEDITLVAVTKYAEACDINEAIKAGITVIGENRVQELLRKQDDLLPVEKHIIGHLQTNKVKYIVGNTDLIHSVDSAKLAGEIDRLSKAKNIVSKVLIQVNIAKEEQKFGVYEEDVRRLLEEIAPYNNIMVCGLMTIPPLVLQNDYNRVTFSKLHKLFIDIKSEKYDNVSMNVLSMGMSRDYEEAIAEGSTMVRVGSAIFKP